MALRHVQVVPTYEALMRDVLGDATLVIGDAEGGIVRPECWIFVNAPHSVVPLHADPEHNFLLQIRGTKRFRIGNFEDWNVVAPELERQYRGGVEYFGVMPDLFTDVVLEPGTGIYVPPDCPHLVENLDDASVSYSMIFYTPQRDRALAAHRVNASLRRLGLTPRRPGQSPTVDGRKAAMARAASRAKHPFRGRPR